MSKNYSFNQRKSQKGATIIEIVVFIAIGLIILGVAAALIAKGMSSSDIGTDTSDLNQLVINAKDVRDVSGYGAAGTDLVPSMSAAKGIPSNMTITAGKPYNQWNGLITIVSTGLGFTLTSPNIPMDACIKEATKLSRPGTLSTSINGGAAVVGQITNVQATAQCTSATANTLSFTSSN